MPGSGQCEAPSSASDSASASAERPQSSDSAAQTRTEERCGCTEALCSCERPDCEQRALQRSLADCTQQLASFGMETPAVDRLPDEVLGKIFSHLSQADVLTGVLPVCRRWRDVAVSYVLSRGLEFVNNVTVPTEEAVRVIESAPSLKSLQLQRRPDAVQLLQAAASRCPELRRLTVEYCDNKCGALLTALGAVFRSCGNLTALSLYGVDVDNGLQLWQELGTALPKLRQLDIMHCFWFAPAELDAELDAVLGSCGQMQQFRFNCVCSDHIISRLAQRWGHCLQVLELNIGQVSDAGLAELAGCTELRELRLLHLNTPGAGLLQLAALSHLERLELDVMGRGVETENIRQFLTQSRSTGRLREISMDSCWACDDSVLTVLAAACRNVQSVALCSCKHVTAAGVRELLQGCRRLLQLNLRGTDPSVAQVLPELPQLAPQLRRLEAHIVLMWKLGKSALERLRAELPHLKLCPYC